MLTQTAYSHGLEAIYAIETIDLSSIRPLEKQSPKEIKKPITRNSAPNCLPLQLEFDFGDEYRGWIESFVLREPIQVLDFSWHAEKNLTAIGKKTIGDLVKQDFVNLKGLGQGHIDEIQKKLQSYLEGKQLDRCTMLEFGSWIRALYAFMDRKKCYVSLESFRLNHLLTLSAAENNEVNRLSAEKKQGWSREILTLLRTEERKQDVAKDFKKIVDVFVKPWVSSRHDLATNLELMERLHRISDRTTKTPDAINFFSSVYFDDQFPICSYLHKVDENLYSSNVQTVYRYRRMIEKASTYFYNPTVSYDFFHLIQLLTQEFALSWEGFPDGFVEKALRQSPRFRVRKGDNSVLIIRLA